VGGVGVAARVWGRGGEHGGGRRSGGGTIGERKEEAWGDSARMRCGGGVRWIRGACRLWWLGTLGFWHAFGPEAQGDANGPALCVPTDCWMFILGYTDSLCDGTSKHI
jgi:hypothetical protein